MKRSRLILALLAGIVALALVPNVRASEFDKKTIVTFNEPVEIPGGIVLSPGQYVIKRPSGTTDPDIVQFLNADETHVYATVMSLPVYRDQPAEEVEFTMEERSSQAPEALKEWFYPGSTIGQEFIYPETNGRLMAQATQPPAFERPRRDSSNVPAQTNATAVSEPAIAESEKAEIAQATAPSGTQAPYERPGATPMAGQQQTAPQTSAQEPVAQAGEELPQTASNFPLIGILGVLALGMGAGLQRLYRYMA